MTSIILFLINSIRARLKTTPTLNPNLNLTVLKLYFFQYDLCIHVILEVKYLATPTSRVIVYLLIILVKINSKRS